MAEIKEVALEETDESFHLYVVDAKGEPRELQLVLEGAGLRVTVFHATEHTLIPLDGPQSRRLRDWLDAHVD